MRHLFIITLCAFALTACSETHQAAPVDDVATSNLGAPK
jgi:uncharacterized protein YcfL